MLEDINKEQVMEQEGNGKRLLEEPEIALPISEPTSNTPSQLLSQHKSISTGSEPPLSQAQLRAKIDSQKELIKGMQKHEAIPLDFPLCDVKVREGGIINTSGDREVMCSEPAAFAIQEDYNDPNSKVGFLCTTHITSLPTHPKGNLYRIFKLTVRNYRRFINVNS